MDFDTIFIGSGHASWHAAMTLVQAGKKVAIVEQDTIGGTCTNYGCDAKILLDGPFQLINQLNNFKGAGVNEVPEVNWQQLMNYKHQVIDTLAPTMANIFEKSNITILNGKGKLIDQNTVQVKDTNYSAEYIVIGTGQSPVKLNIPGNEFIHDSREFLDIEKMPERLTFIGSGIISMEFISMAAMLGKEVHVIEFSKQALNMFHQAYVEKVVEKLISMGVQFHFEQAVTSVEQIDQGLMVTTNSGLQIQTDYVLGATGRVANVDNMGLENLGIQVDKGGIIVDDHLRTNISNVFASGDVISKSIPKLTPTAIFESNYIADQILATNTNAIEYPAIPSVVYTLPRIAQIGVTVEEAMDDSQKYVVKEIPFGKALAFEYKREISAEGKFVFDTNGYLVGATIYSDESEELINVITMIINQKLRANDLKQQIFAFPGAISGVIDLLSATLPG